MWKWNKTDGADRYAFGDALLPGDNIALRVCLLGLDGFIDGCINNLHRHQQKYLGPKRVRLPNDRRVRRPNRTRSLEELLAL